ncbi:MAG: ABC transporter ATP-binding protein [Chloroflexi bacterium]|nr:ABC transporter ATP-binding protein [Chloroflexota bacterium]
MDFILEGRKVTKRFPGVLANDAIDFQLKPGEVHAILGENGAGKSTLMNIFFGLQQPDSGKILIRGKEVRLTHPAVAIAHGIGMVHQNLMLIPHLTVAENVILGREPVRRSAFIDSEKAVKEIALLAQKYGLEVDPTTHIENLPLGVRQRVEILKALYRQADILILDEPTSVLTPQETKELFATLKALAGQGKSVIFITHKLKEVFEVADRITVLRGGKLIGSATPQEKDESSLAEMMVGREVLLRVEKTPAQPGEIVLRVEDLSVKSDSGHLAVDGVGLEVQSGEILGIAGVEGNGQSELVEALAGLRPLVKGRIWLKGREITEDPVRSIREQGVGIIPEDRQKQGLVLEYPVDDNLVLNCYYQKPYNTGLRMDWKKVSAYARELVGKFDVRTPSLEAAASTLSGGNQQKMIIARELQGGLKLLIAAQPTRGVDIAAVEFIHRQLVAARDSGCAILLVSADLDELMALSDRIAVIYRGRIVGRLSAAEATRWLLGRLMLGLDGSKE